MANKPIPVSFKNNQEETKMYNFLKGKPSPSAYVKEMIMKDVDFLAYIGKQTEGNSSNSNTQSKKPASNVSSLSNLKNVGR